MLAIDGVADVSTRVGRSTSFEVVIDGSVLYSKLETGEFPKQDALVEVMFFVVLLPMLLVFPVDVIYFVGSLPALTA